MILFGENKFVCNELRDDAKNFLLFALENKKINNEVLKTFVQEADRYGFFFAPDVLQEKFFRKKEGNIAESCLNWTVEKSLSILSCFYRAPFRVYAGYSSLICFLVKIDLNEILQRLGVPSNVKYGPRNIIVRKEIDYCICIYASLLSNPIENNEKIFSSGEILTILKTIDLDVLDDVFDQWKNVCSDGELKIWINEILLHEDYIFEELKKSSPQKQLESLHFLNGLIGFVSRNWMANVVRYMKDKGLLLNNLPFRSEGTRVRYEKYLDAVSEYAFGSIK